MDRRNTLATFSLIVCTIGRQDTLRRLFDSLVLQTFESFEVIVVDQNAPGILDATIDAYRTRLNIVHVQTGPGLSGARNCGLQYANGRIIAFPDDDCWYEGETLNAIYRKVEGLKSVAIVCGRTVDAEGRPSLSPSLPTAARVSRSNYLGCGNSNCLFFRREVFSDIGNFDVRLGVGAGTGFQSGEESDVILRALDAGLVAHYFPDLAIHHDQVDATITDAQLRRARGYGLGFGAMLRKHRFTPLHVVYRIGRPLLGATLYLLRGNPRVARYKWTWGRSIAEGYRRWPAAVTPRSFDTL